MTSIVCLLWINIASLFIFFFMYSAMKRTRQYFIQPVIFDLVRFFVMLNIITAFIIPSFLRIFSDWRYDRAIGAEPIEIAMVYSIEILSYIIWMVSIVAGVKLFRRFILFKKPGLSRFNDELNCQKVVLDKKAKLFIIILSLLYISNFPFTFEKLLTVLYQAQFESDPTIEIIMTISSVFALYAFALGIKKAGKLTFIFGCIVTFLILVWGLSSGVRSQLISPAMLLIFLYLFVNRTKYLLFTFLTCFILIVLLHNVMLTVRGTSGFIELPIEEKIQSLLIGLKSGENTEKSNFLDSLESRYGEASRLSVGFLRLYNEEKSAGFEPIKSALYAPFPRKYFPDKPQPGSADGTQETIGMFIIQGVMTGAPSNTSNFLTGLHAYWELGLMGVILFSSLSGIIIAFFCQYFGRFRSVGLPFMMILMKPWWMEPKLWISEIVLVFFHLMLPLAFLWLVMQIILEIQNYIKMALKSICRKEMATGAGHTNVPIKCYQSGLCRK